MILACQNIEKSFDGELLLHDVGLLGGALDRVEILEVLGTVSADHLLEAEFSGLVDRFGDVVDVAPRAVRGVHLQPEIGDDLAELLRGELEESRRLHGDVADVGDGLEHLHEILFRLVAERVELNGEFSFHCFLRVELSYTFRRAVPAAFDYYRPGS